MSILPPLLLAGALITSQIGAMPLSFEQRSPTQFRARLSGSTITVQPAGINFGSLTLRFVGASSAARLAGMGRAAPSTYLGSGVRQTFRQFRGITVRQVYPGIDAAFYGNQDHLEYDLILQPGASPRVVRISFEGARRIRIGGNGDLIVEGDVEVLTQKVPRVFQANGEAVEAHYALLSRDVVAIRVGRYNPRLPLTIDPELVYTSSFGSGTGGLGPSAIANDSQGNIYVAGHANALVFPADQGPQSRIAPALMAFSAGGRTATSITVGRASSVTAIGGTPDGSVLYAATPGGVYASSDGGASWSPGSTLPVPNQQAALAISDISVDSSDPDRVFLATSQGVFYSDDGGQTWQLRNSGLPAGDDGSTSVDSVLVSASDPAVVYAMSAGQSANGLFQSTDGGVTWVALTSTDATFSAIATIALNGSDLFVVSQAGVLLKSSDQAASWTTLGSGLGSARTLIIDPANPGNIYVSGASGILKSNDGGLNFHATSFASTTLAVPQQIALDASGVLYVGALEQSTTWVYVSTDQNAWRPQAAAPDLHSLIALGDRVYAGYDATSATFVTKLDPTGSQILYSTFLGGSYVVINSVQVDAQGDCTVAGTALSSDYPATKRIGKASPLSALSAFVTKLNADGTQLIYSTVIGGSAGATLGGMAIDSLGAVYVAGQTSSADFPTTPNAFQPAIPTAPCLRVSSPNLPQTSPGMGTTAFVAKLSDDGSAFAWSTFLTGVCGSAAYGIGIDPAGEVVVSGQTASPDFPVSPTAYQSSGPSSDPLDTSHISTGFVTKLSAAGDQVTASSFIAGGQLTQASALALDSAGGVALTGFTLGLGSGGTPGAYQSISSGGCFYVPTSTFHFPYVKYDVFVLKLDSTLSSATFMSYLAGNCSDQGTGVSMDPSGNVWITGTTSSADFPLRAPYEELGPSGRFVSELSADGSQLLFSSATDGVALTFDSSGAAYLVGTRYNPLISQLSQAELIKIGPALPPVIIDDISPVTESPQTLLAAPNMYRSIAPGELIRLSGRNFGPTEKIAAQPDAGRFPFALAGVTVSFDGVAAPLISVQDREITCLSPFEISQSTQVTVASNGQQSNSVRMSVLTSAPQILSIFNSDGTPNTPDNPAQSGSMVTLNASGLGQTVPPGVDGAVNDSARPSPVARFGVYVEGMAVPVQFVGAAIGMPAGIMRISVTVPAPQDLSNKVSITLNNSASSIINANNSTAYCYVAP